jgi:GxxExxY protein
VLGTAWEIECSGAVVESAIEVHEQLGPGLFEAMYVRCLAAELGLRGYGIATEVAVRARYKHIDLDLAYRLDLVVGDAVIVEVKAVRQLTEVHHAQLLSYLRITNRKIGVLLNFNTALMKHGIKRIYNAR